MASPFTAYFAGIGTVVVALAVGFGGALVLTAPSPSQKEQKSAYERRVEAIREKPVAANPEPANAANAATSVPVSPVITSAMAPTVSTTFSPPLPSAPWPGSPSQETRLAPDPGILQPVVRPAPPVEAVAPDQPVAKPREPQRAERVIEPAGEWKKKGKREQVAQKKQQRRQIVEPTTDARAIDPEDDVIESRAVTTYERERPRAPFGIFNMLIDGGE